MNSVDFSNEGPPPEPFNKGSLGESSRGELQEDSPDEPLRGELQEDSPDEPLSGELQEDSPDEPSKKMNGSKEKQLL